MPAVWVVEFHGINPEAEAEDRSRDRTDQGQARDAATRVQEVEGSRGGAAKGV